AVVGSYVVVVAGGKVPAGFLGRLRTPARSARDATPSFAYARCRCVSTVRAEMTSRRAISRLVIPPAASVAISRSRGVSGAATSQGAFNARSQRAQSSRHTLRVPKTGDVVEGEDSNCVLPGLLGNVGDLEHHPAGLRLLSGERGHPGLRQRQLRLEERHPGPQDMLRFGQRRLRRLCV